MEILIKNNNLSTQTLSLKYGPQLSKNRNLKSYLRRSLDKGNYIINSGIYWKMGNGLSISFWFDSWLPRGPIRNLIYGPLNNHEHNTTISNYITPNRCLQINTSFPLPYELHNDILSTPIALSTNTSDTFSWKSFHYKSIPWKVFFPFILRTIWLARNKFIFDKTPFKPLNVINSSLC